MPTNRFIYNNESLWAGPNGATGLMTGAAGASLLNQLHRLQTLNRSFSFTRTPINQIDQLAALSTEITEPPAITLDFSAFAIGVRNASGVGLTVNQGINCISGILAGTTDDRNYFIAKSLQGLDEAGNANGSTRTCLGFGNGFLSSYSIQAAVGGIATESFTVECSNMQGYTGVSGQPSPAINPTGGFQVSGPLFSIPTASSGLAGAPTAIRYGDITLDISNLNSIDLDETDLKAQSFNITLPLARDSINKLGSLFPYFKSVQVPVTATMSVEAIIGDAGTGSLINFLCQDNPFNVTATLYRPSCPGQTRTVAVEYRLVGAKITNQSEAMSIGPNQTVTLEMEAQVGGANDSNGLFISGIYA
jgi:hypothetical protein